MIWGVQLIILHLDKGGGDDTSPILWRKNWIIPYAYPKSTPGQTGLGRINFHRCFAGS